MRFTNQQHQFYCGVDLHTRMMFPCVLDAAGQIVAHRNIVSCPQPFLKLIAPFRSPGALGSASSARSAGTGSQTCAAACWLLESSPGLPGWTRQPPAGVKRAASQSPNRCLVQLRPARLPPKSVVPIHQAHAPATHGNELTSCVETATRRRSLPLSWTSRLAFLCSYFLSFETSRKENEIRSRGWYEHLTGEAIETLDAGMGARIPEPNGEEPRSRLAKHAKVEHRANQCAHYPTRVGNYAHFEWVAASTWLKR